MEASAQRAHMIVMIERRVDRRRLSNASKIGHNI
jgi:hypothetical protein